MKVFSRSKTSEETDESSEAASGSTRTGKSSAERKASAAAAVSRTRDIVGQLVWILCVLAALVLAIGAVLVAVKANRTNDLVMFIKGRANDLDLGLFDRNDGIKTFKGSSSATKNALLNWGLGAVAWLLVGRIASRIIRP